MSPNWGDPPKLLVCVWIHGEVWGLDPVLGLNTSVLKVLKKYTPGSSNIAGSKMDPDWRCISLKNDGVFHCCVSLPEGIIAWNRITSCLYEIRFIRSSLASFKRENVLMFAEKFHIWLHYLFVWCSIVNTWIILTAYTSIDACLTQYMILYNTESLSFLTTLPGTCARSIKAWWVAA